MQKCRNFGAKVQRFLCDNCAFHGMFLLDTAKLALFIEIYKYIGKNSINNNNDMI